MKTSFSSFYFVHDPQNKANYTVGRAHFGVPWKVIRKCCRFYFLVFLFGGGLAFNVPGTSTPVGHVLFSANFKMQSDAQRTRLLHDLVCCPCLLLLVV